MDYTLCYWPLPFRGQFVRVLLTHVGATWDEVAFDDILAMKVLPPAEQPIPHMGPPLLIDHSDGVTLSQTQAILTYLGEKYDLLPPDRVGRAMTAKVIADANDVLCEMTRNNGAQMWTPEDWQDFQPRLARWMQMFEVLGQRHGLTPETDSGTFLGTERLGVADLVVACLWGVMTDRVPSLRPVLDREAPAIAALADRVWAAPTQVVLRTRSIESFGDQWCSGYIEESLRKVV
ncbi:MAG: glutathione S-transferase family protein [Rhodospirillaceae bacterium]